MDTRELVESIITGEEESLKNFVQTMGERISDALEVRKIELASGLMEAKMKDDEDEEEDDEDEDEDEDDDEKSMKKEDVEQMNETKLNVAIRALRARKAVADDYKDPDDIEKVARLEKAIGRKWGPKGTEIAKKVSPNFSHLFGRGDGKPQDSLERRSVATVRGGKMTKASQKLSKKFSRANLTQLQGQPKPNLPEHVNQMNEAKKLIGTHEHEDGVHVAKVYKDPEYNEYQVHFYKNEKHMGEGPVYYTDDKNDAHSTAKAQLKQLSGGLTKKSNNMNEAKSAWKMFAAGLEDLAAEKRRKDIEGLNYNKGHKLMYKGGEQRVVKGPASQKRHREMGWKERHSVRAAMKEDTINEVNLSDMQKLTLMRDPNRAATLVALRRYNQVGDINKLSPAHRTLINRYMQKQTGALNRVSTGMQSSLLRPPKPTKQ